MKLPRDRCAEIVQVVQQVYTEAGLNIQQCNPGVVPLYDLIGAYPLRIAALSNLTYQTAIKFLSIETGHILESNQEDRKLSGFLYVYEFAKLFYGCILLEKEEPIARQRFSAAHELGHYLLHCLPQLQSMTNTTRSLILSESFAGEDDTDAEKPLIQLSSGTDFSLETRLPIAIEQMELEADQFAAELLMPAITCSELVQKYRRRFGTKPTVLAGRLAPEFLVSRMAMERRLADLDLPDCLDCDAATL
jgi:Zn-dependent peptidase ImmA (M78 family)